MWTLQRDSPPQSTIENYKWIVNNKLNLEIKRKLEEEQFAFKEERLDFFKDI